MKLKIVREFFSPTETLGSLYVDGKFFCFTLEDTDRGLKQSSSLEAIQAKKIYGSTAIPTGKYKVSVTHSNRFKRPMPLIHNVKGFEGVRLHGGNTHHNTEGCPLIARQRNVNKVHPTVKGVMNWIFGSTESQLTAMLKNGEHELEITKQYG